VVYLLNLGMKYLLNKNSTQNKYMPVKEIDLSPRANRVTYNENDRTFYQSENGDEDIDNIRPRENIWVLLTKLGIVILESILSIIMMIALISLVAFDLVDGNIPIGLFNTAICTIIVASRVHRFMKLFN